MNTSLIIVVAGFLIFIAHLFERIFSRTKIPDVLLLILIGLVIGPLTGSVLPVDFGFVGPVFVSIALLIILFQGGTRIDLSSLVRSAKGTTRLTIAGFISSAAVAAIVAYLFLGFDALTSLLFGSIVGETSSAIVIPLVENLKIRQETKTILSLESALSDVLVIVIAVSLLGALTSGSFSILGLVGNTASSLLVAVLIGAVTGVIWSTLLDKVRHMQDSIFTTPAFVFVLYGFVDLLGFSGAIAALSFGITLGNVQLLRLPLLSRYTPLNPVSLSKREKAFFSELVFLLKTSFFIYMGISIQFVSIEFVITGLIIAFLMLLGRIVVVKFVVSRETPVIDASLMASVGPKGLAAAVLASLPVQYGVEGGQVIQNLTYMVILFSIILTSATVFLVERTSVYSVFSSIYSGFSGSRGGQVNKVTTESVPPPLGRK